MSEIEPNELSGAELSGARVTGAELTSSERQPLTKNERHLVWFLRFIGCWTLLAFLAAIMPQQWMAEIANVLSIEPFPSSPLTFYLARNLSLLYGFGGIGLLVICNDVHRYRPLFPLLAIGTIAFGLTQLLVDAMSTMPIWWTLGESLSTTAGGAVIWWLDRRAK